MNVDAEAIPAGPETLPRARPRALLLAAGTVWLPCVLPIATGMLHDCSHCVQTFLLWLPIVPGVVFGMLLALDDAAFVVAAIVPTLALFGGLYLAARRLPRKLLYVVQTLVIVLVGFSAIGLAHALRM